jgi:hypothetical protein
MKQLRGQIIQAGGAVGNGRLHPAEFAALDLMMEAR